MYEIGKEELSALEDLFITKKFFRYQGSGVETQTLLFEKEFSTLIWKILTLPALEHLELRNVQFVEQEKLKLYQNKN